MKKSVPVLTFVMCSAMAAAVLAGCTSVPLEADENLSEKELIQLAQASYDEGNTKAALFYYETVVDRFGNKDDSYIMAKYEIAHLYVKDGKFDEAKPILLDVLSFYEDEEAARHLNAAYKKLARIDLAKIPE